MTRSLLRPALLASAVLLSAASGALAADGAWQASDGFPGSLRAGSREVPVGPGDQTSVQVRRMPAGAKLTVMRGTEVLTPEPVTVGPDGSAIIPLTVPSDAGYGLQPLTVISSDPAATIVTDLKLSRVLPASGEAGYALTSAATDERSYQVAFAEQGPFKGKLFVVAANGQGPSRLMRLDAATLKQEAAAEVATDADGKPVDVFAVGMDDAHGQVWTANTRANTVTVYDAGTLKPVKVFPAGTVMHPRDVVVDAAAHRAYANAALSNRIEVFDTENLTHVGTLQIEPPEGKGEFSSMTLDLDPAQGRIYSVSKDGDAAGWVDLKTGESHTFDVPGLISGSGIAHDPETGRIFVTGQDSNNVIILDAEGKKLSDTYIGAGGLSIAFDPVSGHVYAAARAAGTVSVLDEDGKLLANLPVGELPNQVKVAADGTVYVVTMNGPKGDNDPRGAVEKITPAS
ncbi:hypothetical protein GR170_08780 [Pseudooceanicola sp. GBMRC 2024]|uniref:YncE family protein n=1 Tax=Pseudooceanicola albus TaxID=2692189 RepID=A0A6L7G344_9RHOB|nr:YncE family protein [Pseudooceanicola albus]MXN17928.1 hypothetical protein [Pseudooceanicola albus]